MARLMSGMTTAGGSRSAYVWMGGRAADGSRRAAHTWHKLLAKQRCAYSTTVLDFLALRTFKHQDIVHPAFENPV